MADTSKPSTSNTNPDQETRRRATKNLFEKAMKGQWQEVLDIYGKYPWIHDAKITRSEATALHIAVSDIKEEIVEKLIDVIKSGTSMSSKNVLSTGDELGNTPLHTAATLGNVNMCSCIANVDKSLIGIRNKDGETPLFMAALHGHKHAFLWLHLCQDGKGYEYSRRNDGDTILHCAISGDYFELAFQIIHLYKDLVNSVNEQGLSPLHLLATRPSAFRSSSHLGRFNALIYHCTFVENLEVEKSQSPFLLAKRDEKEPICPPNYETCHNLIRLMWKVFELVLSMVTKNASEGTEGGRKPIAPDAENPDETMKTATEATQDKGKNPAEDKHNIKAQGHQLLPPNYSAPFEFVKLVSKTMLIILGLGSTNIRKLREKKQKHTWSVQIMNELLKRASENEYEFDGRKPQPVASGQEEDSQENKSYGFGSDAGDDNIFDIGEANLDVIDKPVPMDNASRANHLDMQDEVPETKKKESPILIAAKNGITEIVEKVLEMFPIAIHDMNYQKKNIVLLAVENRQPLVYELLLKLPNILKESVFRKVDYKGNSALHLAARLGENKPWLIPGAALQMQWEIRWYKFVKESMGFNFFVRYNNQNKSSKEIFTESHKELLEAGGKWLTSTSESCSVVAALIATVTFATSATIPGGVKENIGTPNLENQSTFNLFAISSLVAFCFSVTSLVMFLAILTSRYEEKNFGKDLPRKLILGLTSLFVSIASMIIGFCAGHFFVLNDKLKYAAWPVYAVTCLPITVFAIAQFPLYFDLIRATFKKVPQRSYKPISN